MTREALAPVAEAPRPARRWLRWAFDGALVVVLVTAVSAWQARGNLQGQPPAFSLRSLDGAQVDNASLLGKRAVLVFWAPWCGVCRLESSNISALKELLGGRAHVVSVASEYSDLREVQTYVERHEVDYPVLLGGTRTARDFGVRAFPTMFFLDEQGRVTRSVTGYATMAGLLWRTLW